MKKLASQRKFWYRNLVEIDCILDYICCKLKHMILIFFFSRRGNPLVTGMKLKRRKVAIFSRNNQNNENDFYGFLPITDQTWLKSCSKSSLPELQGERSDNSVDMLKSSERQLI